MKLLNSFFFSCKDLFLWFFIKKLLLVISGCKDLGLKIVFIVKSKILLLHTTLLVTCSAFWCRVDWVVERRNILLSSYDRIPGVCTKTVTHIQS